MSYKFSNCLNCDTNFRYCDSTQTGKYCNNKCQAEYRTRNITYPKIEQGLIDNTRTLKGYLENTQGPNCSICKCEPVWNNMPLVMHVDHIDGNSDHNFPVNLRLVCPNCHSQTDTFCARNFKNTKRSNRMRSYRTVRE